MIWGEMGQDSPTATQINFSSKSTTQTTQPSQEGQDTLSGQEGKPGQTISPAADALV